MASALNPHRDPKPWQIVTIGGRTLKAILVAVDGNEIEDEWKVQKGTNTNSATAVSQGTKLIESFGLTLEAPNAESFDDLRDLWTLLAPAPSPGKKGPFPPTLTIVNAFANYIGLTAINRKKWKGPYPYGTNSWRVDVTLIQSSPPTPAGTGTQDPAKAATAPGGPPPDPQVAALQKQVAALAAQAAAV